MFVIETKRGFNYVRSWNSLFLNGGEIKNPSLVTDIDLALKFSSEDDARSIISRLRDKNNFILRRV